MDLWPVILGHWRLVVLITITGTAFAIFYQSSLPNLYTTGVKILVEKSEPVGTQKSYQDVTGAAQTKGDEDYYGTQISIITGRKIRESVASELGKIPVSYSVDAFRLRSTRIISLSVTSTDPKWSAKIANKFGEIFVRQSTEDRQFINQQILKFIPDEKEINDGGGAEEDRNDSNQMGFDKLIYAGSLSSITSDSVIQSLRAEKAKIEAQVRELSERYKPQHPAVKALTDRLDQVDLELKDRTQKIVSNLRANLAGDIKIATVKVLEDALVPGRPSKPDRPKGILFGFFISLFSSIGLVLVLEYANQKIVTDEDAHKSLNVPFLGYVPLVKNLSKPKQNEKSFVPTPGPGVNIVDVLANNSMLADSVASVRTHVLFSMAYEKSKRIMFTSCLPDEGKSTVATLLALSLAQMGRKVLLIDADLRRPFLHQYLNLRNEKGLTDYLVGNASMEEVVMSVSGSTLKLIPGGTISPNPSELLSSERFGFLLDAVSEHFDRVVIDVPPVLYIPDALVVAKHIHSGILVCGSGMIDKKVAQKVKAKFDVIGHALIGVVINKVNYEQQTYRYHYYKKYKNYYTKEKKK